MYVELKEHGAKMESKSEPEIDNAVKNTRKTRPKIDAKKVSNGTALCQFGYRTRAAQSNFGPAWGLRRVQVLDSTQKSFYNYPLYS